MHLLRNVAAQSCVLSMLAGVTLLAQVPRDRPATGSTATGTAVISGRMTVTTAAGIAPVRRARVVLESDALKQPLTTDTDTDGRYRFTTLPAGAMRVHGEKAGFVAKIADPRRAFEPPAAVDVKVGQSLTWDLPMVPGAALEGRILKENGDPAMGVVVSAVRMAYDINGRRPTAVRQVKTDDLGRFRVHTLPAGDYQIDAAPDPLDAGRQPMVPGTRQVVPARTYYPGSARLEEARTVAVTVGQNIGSLDFTMSSLAMSALRGKVVLADGTAVLGPAVRMQRVGGSVGEVRGSSMIESNEFMYPSVPSGEFWMMAVGRSARGAEPEFGVVRLTMAGEDVTNLSVSTAKPPGVSGKVEGIATLAGLSIVAHETAFEWPSFPGEAPFSWTAPVAADGSFAFKVLPGPRLLRVTGLPSGVAIKSISLGEKDVTDAPFEIAPGGPAPAIRVVLTPETSAVSGVVKDASGRPAAGARVVVFSADETLWGARSRAIHTVEARADGAYELIGVLPGQYFVVATSYLESLAWMDAAVLRQLSAGPGANVLTLPPGKITVPLVVKR
ncbi:MAG: carboxypeptidase-like regulatory domain-containing protein [Acidobacteriota bacterium]